MYEGDCKEKRSERKENYYNLVNKELKKRVETTFYIQSIDIQEHEKNFFNEKKEKLKKKIKF